MSGTHPGRRTARTDSRTTSDDTDDADAGDDDGVWVEVYPDTGAIKTPLLVRDAATRVPGRSYRHFESRDAAKMAARREEAQRRNER